MVRLLIAFMRLIAPLPLPLLRALGWGFGMLLFALAHARRHVVEVNLRHCFPELSEGERATLARQHFVQVGQSLIDRAWLWHAPLAVVRQRLQWTGAVEQLAGEQPTVIFAPHFVGLDAGGLALTLHSSTPVAFIYVTQSNPDLERWVNQGRERGGPVKPYFRHDGVKHIVTALRHCHITVALCQVGPSPGGAHAHPHDARRLHHRGLARLGRLSLRRLDP